MAGIDLLVTVIGLAETAFALSKTVYGLIKTFEDSPQAIIELSQNVQTLGQVLKQINEKGRKAPDGTQFQRALRDETFTAAAKNCKRDFDRLEAIVDKLNPKGYSVFVLRLRNTFKWVYLEKHIESLTRALEAHKSLFNILLSLSIDEKATEISVDTKRILQLVEVVYDRASDLEQRSEQTFHEAEKELEKSPPEPIEADVTLVVGQVGNSESLPLGEDLIRHLEDVPSGESEHLLETPFRADSAGQLGLDRRSPPETQMEHIVPINDGPIEFRQAPEPRPRIQTPQLVKALVTAAQYGFTDTVSLLLETGVDVNSYDGDSTPIFRAAYWRHPEDVKTLLDYNADPNLRLHHGDSALQVACARIMIGVDTFSIIRMLVEHGADTKEPGLLHRSMNGLDKEN